MALDTDLETLTPDELRAEVVRLRSGIREHRDRSGHDLCWFVPELWNLLPEKTLPEPQVPSTEEFLTQCRVFRESLK